MPEFLSAATLLFVLLNPFLIQIYLIDLLEKKTGREYAGLLVRASLIAIPVFFGFAAAGDAIFRRVVQAEFGSFQIFGGIVFLMIGVQFVFQGPRAIALLRGDSKNLVEAIAVPVLVGPGTIGASVVIGRRVEFPTACAAILLAVTASVIIMIVLKMLHDFVRPKSEPLVERYIEITGRLFSLLVGTVAVDMIMQGLDAWITKFRS